MSRKPEHMPSFRNVGHRLGEAIALNNLGTALLKSLQFQDAITNCENAVTICREIGDDDGERTALGALQMARAAQHT